MAALEGEELMRAIDQTIDRTLHWHKGDPDGGCAAVAEALSHLLTEEPQ